VARFGLRKTSVVGTSLFLLGYLSSAFATKLWHLILGYSILSGKSALLNFIHLDSHGLAWLFIVHIIAGLRGSLSMFHLIGSLARLELGLMREHLQDESRFRQLKTFSI